MYTALKKFKTYYTKFDICVEFLTIVCGA